MARAQGPGVRATSMGAIVAVLLAVTAVTTGAPTPAAAATTTFTVDSLGDAVDATPGDGTCATAQGACTLRAALGEAGAGSGDAHVVQFGVAGTIRLAAPLPEVSTPTAIDGSSAPGYVAGAQPVARITCDDAPTVADGLVITAPHSEVRAVELDGCTTSIAVTATAPHGRITGTWLNVDGLHRAYPYGGRHGIVADADDVVVGGPATGDRNVLHAQDDVLTFTDSTADGASNRVVVQGSWFGIRPNGGTIGDPYEDIAIGPNVAATVGGTGPGEGNVIAGAVHGVHVQDNGAGVVIQGNRIGTDPTGTLPRGNNNGVTTAVPAPAVASAGGPPVLVGGTAPGAGNLLSGNNWTGVQALTAATIQGNLIGTDATGTAALPNGAASVANGSYGAVSIGYTGFGGASSGVVVGGAAPGAGNVIAGNASHGIHVDGADFTIQGNLIGTDATGQVALPNGGAGIVGSGNNLGHGTIGGIGPGEGNSIAHGPAQGVRLDHVPGHAPEGIAIRGNRTYDNAGLSIDLLSHSPHNAANGDQAPPTITSVTPGEASTAISGTVTSDRDGPLLVDVYASDQCQAAWGTGEAKQYLGTISVPHAGGAVTPFSGSVGPSSAGSVVTATTTQATNGTSQFSNCGPVTDLEVTATANMDEANLGSDVAAELKVTNAGPSPISGLTLPLDLSEGDGAAVPDPTVEASQGTVTGPTHQWSIGSLAPGASATVCIRGDVTRTFYAYEYEGITRYAATVFAPGLSTRSAHAVDPFRGDDEARTSVAISEVTTDPPRVATRDVCPTPTLTIDDASVVRPSSGTSPMTFTVRLSRAALRSVTVDYATVKGLAVPVEDYTQTAGTLTIPAGQTSATVTVPVVGNRTDEPAKAFTVRLADPVHAHLPSVAAATATGTILPNHALAGCPTGSTKPRRLICHLYADALGRAPDRAGLDHWVAKLASGTSRSVVARSFLLEPEGLRKAADRAYVLYLGRHGTAAELSWWAAAYRTGAATTQDTRVAVLASAEYLGTVGATDRAFVEHLYTDVFRRPGDAAGVQYWVGRLVHGTRAQVATRFLAEPEGRRKIVGDLYLRFLRRDATRGEADAGVLLLGGGRSEVDVVASIASGAEYFDRPSS